MKDPKSLKVVFGILVAVFGCWGLVEMTKHKGPASSPTPAEVTPGQPGSPGAAPVAIHDEALPRAGDQRPQDATSKIAQTAPMVPAPAAAPAPTVEKLSILSRIFGKSEPKVAPGAPTGNAPGTPGAVSAVNPAVTTPVVPEVKQTCFKYTFSHRSLASHPDGEACSHHKNLIRLKHPDLNPKSLCLRVNGTPVAYEKVKGKTDEFLIAPIAGPKAKITAQFCTGDINCLQDCKIPKDEFLEAIGGNESETGSKKAKKPTEVVQWDPSDKQRDTDVAAEVEGELNRELAGTDGADLSIFKDWMSSEPEAPSCGSNLAKRVGE